MKINEEMCSIYVFKNMQNSKQYEYIYLYNNLTTENKIAIKHNLRL